MRATSQNERRLQFCLRLRSFKYVLFGVKTRQAELDSTYLLQQQLKSGQRQNIWQVPLETQAEHKQSEGRQDGNLNL